MNKHITIKQGVAGKTVVITISCKFITFRLKTLGVSYCNILTYVSSINTWASGDSPLAQLVKELDLCLFLCVMRRL